MGATLDNNGANFAVYSSTATKVELCLFDNSGHTEIARIPLFSDEQGIWHLYIKGLMENQLYGYRIYGEYAPEKGLRHNPNKLLVDPYAKALFGEFSHSDSHRNDGDYFERDSACDMPKCKVINFSTYRAKRPSIPWHKTVIYECHVKGISEQFPLNNAAHRGRYAALCDSNFINHIKTLGVTAIELLPVHAFLDEAFVHSRKLTNFWGYNSLNFFTPHTHYGQQNAHLEFKQMVSTLHAHHIEVIIDVVFNHTAEGNENGPLLSLRGFDNGAYYRLHSDDPSLYINDTGCGNTLNLDHPKTVQLVLDSLRYWYNIMGVDGFRFDLAPILGRNKTGFNSLHTFFQTIAQDPSLKNAKFIAEPWDIGPGGYQLGQFIAPWREWNDQYRDTVRRFWRGDAHMLPHFAHYFHGSNRHFEVKGRASTSSINFITAHDGFTLCDLVSFNHKYNFANQEQNNDGHNENYSYNWGHEGLDAPSDVLKLRTKMQKNMLLTLCLSSGVPMLTGGVECGNSQDGNNNAYCQDNPIGWVNWPQIQKPHEHELYIFITQLLAIRAQYSLYRQNHFIHDNDPRYTVNWCDQHGQIMTDHAWHNEATKALGYHIIDREDNCELLLLFNASEQEVKFELPVLRPTTSQNASWQIKLTTCDSPVNNLAEPKHFIRLSALSAWVLSN